MELSFGNSGISCYYLNIEGAKGSVDITEAKYNELIRDISNNSGLIKIYGSEYGDGICFSKYHTTSSSWD